MSDYDVIVVGGRCAGAPTAMLLARQGHRVLLVDRAPIGSDTISTHLLHPPGVAALDRWGLLGQLAASGCPAIDTYHFDFDGIVLSGNPLPAQGFRYAYGPRRTVLDALLVEAAAQAGAEVRDGFAVQSLVFDGPRVTGVRGRARGGVECELSATVVVGADGRRSAVAEAVEAPTYRERPIQTAGYYAYWRGLPIDEFRVYVRPNRAVVVVPTHDDLRLVLVGWPRAEFAANKADLDGTYQSAIDAIPELATLARGARRETRLVGTGDMLNRFRRPFGPGWALVGDAGYVRDPCTAQGISDSFRDAELLASGLDAALTGRMPFDPAMQGYQQARDAAVDRMYDFTGQLAGFEPLPRPVQLIFKLFRTDQDAMDRFVSAVAGTTPVGAVFHPSNLGRIVAARGRRSVHQLLRRTANLRAGRRDPAMDMDATSAPAAAGSSPR